MVHRAGEGLTPMPGGALVRNGLLALLSAAIGLAACEAALRLFYPRYQLAANPVPEDAAGTYRLFRDPDTGVAHRVISNNLGGRQSRDFPPEALDTAVNIAFFGDSQTQNAFMPAQYSYTEPLDFLFNVGAQVGDAGSAAQAAALREPRVNVLGFGTADYGPARSYLRWRNLPARSKFAHVFYMVVHNDRNDLRTAVRSGLVLLGDSGEVLPGGPPRTPTWKRVLARLHLTYLAIDAWQRLALGWPAGELGDGPSGLEEHELSRDKAQLVFRDLMLRWNREVKEFGGVFHLVLLPNPPGGFGAGLSSAWLRHVRNDADLRSTIGFFDLAACFEAMIPGFDYDDWRFENDAHWNPAGTMVAATCLYRYLEDALGLPERTDEHLAHMRHAYYQAFLESSAWEGQRYAPDAAWARPPLADAAQATPSGQAIVARYLALELALSAEEQSLGAVRAAREAGALASSVWDVYANIGRRLLVYVKPSCSPSWRARDAAAGRFFFLHAVPFTPEKLPPHGAPSGFVNLDDTPLTYVRRTAAECVFFTELPDYPLARISTGQFTRRGHNGQYDNLWSAEFAMPLARSVWNVYTSPDGRGLNYMKEACGPADTAARFFLHVHPLRSADLPPGALRYANLDFGGGGAVERDEDGTCRASAALPDYPIDFVRTGQFRAGFVFDKRLWSERIDFAEKERASPRPAAMRHDGGVSSGANVVSSPRHYATANTSRTSITPTR